MDEVRLERAAQKVGFSLASCAAGERLLSQGDVAVWAGLVLEGRMRMEASSGQGQVAVMGWAGPGEVFAEAYAVLKDEPLMVDVVADRDGTVLWFDAARLLLLSDDPDCAVLARNLCAIMARRNVGLSRRAVLGAPRTIRGKLMAYLAAEQRAAGARPGQWFEVPVGRQQLADYLGADRSALSRELGRMDREGLVAVSGRRFKINGGRRP
ncbi:Crp/Fnr family transcriptional regulator [Atopobiaceae bacterium 24-176]